MLEAFLNSTIMMAAPLLQSFESSHSSSRAARFRKFASSIAIIPLPCSRNGLRL